MINTDLNPQENEPKSQSPQAQSQEPSHAKPSIVESIKEVERLYEFLNEKFKLGLNHDNLIITIEETSKNTLGFFRPSESPKSWYKDLSFKHQANEPSETETATEQDESINHICLNSHHLRAKPYETLTHEYAHYLNKVLDNYKGNGNNYHTAQFKSRAEQMFLRVEKGTYGFNTTSETPEFKQMIEKEFKPSETAFKIFQETEQERNSRLGITPKDENGNPIIPTKPEPKGRLKKWVCDCGYIIRASENGKNPDKPLKAICGYCESPFKIEETQAQAKPETKREPETKPEQAEPEQNDGKRANESNDLNPSQAITPQEFNSYESLRIEGLFNMFDIKAVCEYTDLSKEKVLIIMKQYDDLKTRFKNE